MPDWVRIGDTPQIETGSGATVVLDDVVIALFRNADKWHAIEGRCPHKGASLGNGAFDGECVTCPLHSWKFAVATGAGDRGASVKTIAVKSEADGLWIDRESLPKKPAPNEPDGVHRYLIRYGALGWVGLFGTVHRLDCRFKDRVVLQTFRGLELGEVLTDPSDPQTQQSKEKPTGELLRIAATDEVSLFESASEALVSQLLRESQTALSDLEVAADVIDAELLFDQKKAVLYYLGDASPKLTDLRESLAAKLGVDSIEWQSLIEQPQGCGSGGGCSSGGCGSSGGGGCSSGGCSTGSDASSTSGCSTAGCGS